jgi:ribosomal protein S18 acetylase RimI-like enzyme
MIAVSEASPALAGRQGAWIARMEPWVSLGYGAAGLSRFLRRSALAGGVWVARDGHRRDGGPSRDRGGPVLGVLSLQEGVLLGNFVALLAVRPEEGGRGIGRALMAHVEAKTARKRRWLFVSADADNRAALGFYRKLGFVRVGRLPGLVSDARTEILLRKAARRPAP